MLAIYAIFIAVFRIFFTVIGSKSVTVKTDLRAGRKTFTVRFTVKTICLEAIEDDRWRGVNSCYSKT
jgi:hypothetical protein